MTSSCPNSVSVANTKPRDNHSAATVSSPSQKTCACGSTSDSAKATKPPTKTPNNSCTKLEIVVDVIAASFKLERDSLFSKTRVQSIAWPRQIAMYLMHEVGGEPVRRIADYFGFTSGGSNVVHGIASVKERCSVYPGYHEQVAKLSLDCKAALERG